MELAQGYPMTLLPGLSNALVSLHVPEAQLPSVGENESLSRQWLEGVAAFVATSSESQGVVTCPPIVSDPAGSSAAPTKAYGLVDGLGAAAEALILNRIRTVTVTVMTLILTFTFDPNLNPKVKLYGRCGRNTGVAAHLG